jgi:6-phospho-3-hexuloisomerase
MAAPFIYKQHKVLIYREAVSNPARGVVRPDVVNNNFEIFRKSMIGIASYILESASKISSEQVSRAVSLLIEAYRDRKKILVMGAGRSGLVGRAFAMRLLHLGYQVNVLGDTIVPPIGKGDIVIAISGSGRTRLIVTAAEAARTVGARILGITSFPDSPLAQLCEVVVVVPGRTKVAREEDYFMRQILGIHEPLAPLGTLFEDTAMVFLDGLVVELMERLGLKEEDLEKRHANIEV